VEIEISKSQGIKAPLSPTSHTTTTPHGVAMRSRSRQNPDIADRMEGANDSTRTSGEAKKRKR